MATKAEIANITAKLEREIKRDGATALEKVQFALQKDWLKKNLGQVEIIFNAGESHDGR